LQGTAQRCASLPPRRSRAGSRSMALRRAWTLLGSRKNSKPRYAKCLKMRHAVKRQSPASSRLLRRAKRVRSASCV